MDQRLSRGASVTPWSRSMWARHTSNVELTNTFPHKRVLENGVIPRAVMRQRFFHLWRLVFRHRG